MMRRLAAQRDGLEWGTAIAAPMTTCADAPERRIWGIDRILQCHPSCIPLEQDFLQGEAEEMLKKTGGPWGENRSRALRFRLWRDGQRRSRPPVAARPSPMIADIMAPCGLPASGQPLVGFEQVRGPETVAPRPWPRSGIVSIALK